GVGSRQGRAEIVPDLRRSVSDGKLGNCRYRASERRMSSEIANIVEMARPEGVIDAAGQVHADDRLIDLWLHGRSPETQRAYRADAGAFTAAVRKPLCAVTLGDLQRFADSLDARLEPASKHRRLSAVKSLFAFAHLLGYLP